MRGDAGVVVALHDGFFGCGTGAGHSNRRLLELLDELLPPHVELTVLPVRLEQDSAHYDADWHCQVRAALAGFGHAVRVVPVDNGTRGRERFGGLDAFTALIEATARVVAGVRPQFRRGLVLLLDVPFLEVAATLAPRPGWDTLVLPRSSAALHCPRDTRRVEWERTCLRQAVAAGTWVGAISPAMRRHLVEDLGVDQAAVVDLINGLTEHDHGGHGVGPGGCCTRSALLSPWIRSAGAGRLMVPFARCPSAHLGEGYLAVGTGCYHRSMAKTQKGWRVDDEIAELATADSVAQFRAVAGQAVSA